MGDERTWRWTIWVDKSSGFVAGSGLVPDRHTAQWEKVEVVPASVLEERDRTIEQLRAAPRQFSTFAKDWDVSEMDAYDDAHPIRQDPGFWRDGETCQRCGHHVGPHLDSYWRASDELWGRVVEDRFNVLCPPCFSALAREADIPIWWAPQLEEQADGLVPAPQDREPTT